MADSSFITKNNLTVEVGNQKKFKQKVTLIFGGTVAVLALFVALEAAIIILVLTAIVWLLCSGSETLKAGAIGEDLCIDTLLNLPDNYTIFNQVNVPNIKSKTGFNEADVIVVGPQSVFVVEVKHNNGSISGGVDDRDWTVQKVGRGGTAYEKSMRNPISQVKKLVWLLSEEFKKTKNRVWIQGVVVFSNSTCDVNVESNDNVPVLQLHELTKYISEYTSRSSSVGPDASIAKLAEFKKS